MRVALTGPNGCGKSTLLKTVLGQLATLAGHCHCPLSTAYLDQTLSQLDPSLSVMEHLGLQDSPLVEGALRTRLAQLQLGADRIALPLGALSGGERLKAALACALWRRQPAQLLLLDEPTNHLDLASSLAIETRPGGFPGAMLVVSRRRLPAGAAADAPSAPAGGRLAASGLVTREGGPKEPPFSFRAR
ncbi:ATP-binding cassette domain-containing protein [Serratia ureilytica]